MNLTRQTALCCSFLLLKTQSQHKSLVTCNSSRVQVTSVACNYILLSLLFSLFFLFIPLPRHRHHLPRPLDLGGWYLPLLRLPFYHEIKILFILWLMSPYGNGAKVMYKNVIHPELHRREEVSWTYTLASFPAPFTKHFACSHCS